MDAQEILAQYRSSDNNSQSGGQDFDCHTPDPTKYHDPANLMIGSQSDGVFRALTTRTHGFNGLRGVVIPRAGREGGSRGRDAWKPATKIYLDPDKNNSSIVVDLAEMKARAGEMAAYFRAQATDASGNNGNAPGCA